MQANFVVKQLLDNGIIPMDTPSSPSILLELHHVVFSLSFTLSIMSLWLQTIGIPLLPPSRTGPGTLTRREGASLVATILYWGGAIFLAAYIFLTVVVSSSEMSIIVKLAYAVFGARTVHTLFG